MDMNSGWGLIMEVGTRLGRGRGEGGKSGTTVIA